ncbi:PITH domain-containing protein [Immersiella caudata]|uniref:PITH domain-containing protein n=1 Tax=Immersiella caudata TaxID=314043 RepID=A0AA40CCF3_9PEZI|nr:PITH domain-containing protein [Immersiella caudata]
MSSSAGIKELIRHSHLVFLLFFIDTSSPAYGVYEDISNALSVPNFITFAKVNVMEHNEIGAEYQITKTPTFIYFNNGKLVEKVHGDDPRQLSSLMKQFQADAEKFIKEGGTKASSSASGVSVWLGAELPRGYSDVSNQIELQRSELLNVDSEAGSLRVLFEPSKPSALSGGKSTSKDWVESDTDEQLMLFMPFQSMLKLHTLQITSLPPQDDDDDEAPMRPRKIKLFSNKPHNLGFDEAEDMAATQTIELSEKDWNAEGTANVPLRYVKFQNVTSLVMFIVDGDGDSEKVRLDRLRLIGEAGEKREMGKLEKIGDGPE